MSGWIEQKYANMLGAFLRNFKVKTSTPYLANFSCTICHDSKKNKRKSRGYIGEKDGRLFYYCHNCHASMNFSQFLYHENQSLFKEYSLEKFSSNSDSNFKRPILEDTPLKFFGNDVEGPLLELQKISQLPWDHFAKKYVIGRQIPLPYHAKFRFAPNFAKFVNTLIPNKLNEFNKEGRLIIPFLDKNGNCFGFQGRSFEEETKMRYITIMLTDKMKKVFGLDTVDFNQLVYILEGPLDSTFIENSVAMAGSDLNLTEAKNCVYVLDNEKRNKEIVNKMSNIIDKGHKICIWPDFISYKDINEMILAGKKPIDIKKIIDYNTFQGLEASLQFSRWRKC